VENLGAKLLAGPTIRFRVGFDPLP
jgi:hypothetical protein